jgi:hypothetical protein
MGFDLADGVRFCETSGRFIFLDLARDRYSCLPAEAEPSFRRLVLGARLTSNDRQVLGDLARDGLLRPSRRRPPLAPPDLSAPDGTLVFTDREVDRAMLVRALWRLGAAAVELRIRPLSRIVRRLERRKRLLPGYSEDIRTALLEVAAAFRRTELFAAPLDRCLPRSIAAFEALIDRRVPASLVFGVRLQPFGAHCWVQHCRTLVNESVDQVRNFTPILVI